MGVEIRADSPVRREPPGSERFSRLRDEAAAWCVGRSWRVRVPLLLYLAWIGVGHLSDPATTSLFGGVTLGIHELGHLLLFWAGPFLAVAGGSLAQLAAPVAAALLLLRQRDYFGVSVAAAWLSFSLFGLAAYVGDARAQNLPIVGLTADPIHDWNYLLGALGFLEWDRALSVAMRASAFLVWAGALALGAWLCWKMARGSGERGERPART